MFYVHSVPDLKRVNGHLEKQNESVKTNKTNFNHPNNTSHKHEATLPFPPPGGVVLPSTGVPPTSGAYAAHAHMHAHAYIHTHAHSHTRSYTFIAR